MKTVLLKSLIANYREISRLTESLLVVSIDEQAAVVEQRGILIQKSALLFNEMSLVPPQDHDPESASLELELQQLMLSVITQEELVYNELDNQKKRLKSEIPVGSNRQRVAGVYQLNTR